MILGDHTLGDQGGGEIIFGTESNDTLSGGAGNDFIVARGGDDTVTGGAGEDAIFGDYFDDWYSRSDGSGTGGSAASAGGSGSGTAVTFNDYLSGGAGSDLLVGGMGNDELRGGDDGDVLYGDTYGGGDSNYTWGAGWEDPRFDAATGSGSASGSGGGSYTFDDLLNGGAGDDILLGQLGEDTLYGGLGSDTLFGGTGNDTLVGGTQAGETETVTFLTENFDDDTGGFTYADGAFRGTSNPYYEQGFSHTGSGTEGRVGVLLGGIDGTDITDGMSGGFSNTFNVSGAATNAQITFSYLLDADNAFENDEYAEVLISIDGQLYGLDGNDYITRISGGGNSGWQTVTIDLGNLSAGDHTVTLGGFLNKKTYSNEDAFIKFSDVEITGSIPVGEDTSDDSLYGGAGDDDLSGGAGNDTLDGGEGTDMVDGEAGDDTATFVGGQHGGGIDQYDGGTGTDTLKISLTQAEFDNANIFADLVALKAFIEDNNDPNTDSGATETFSHLGIQVQDWENLVVLVDGVEVEISPPGLFTEGSDSVDFDDVVEGNYEAGTQYDALGSDDTVWMASSLAEATEAGFDPTIDFHAGAGDDTIIGRALDDLIYGDAGDDTLTGGAGDDTLVGGTGNDSITGGDGLFDSLSGGEGNDSITDNDGVLEAHGGEGNDTIAIKFDSAWDNDNDDNNDPASINRISGGTGSDVITVTMASLGFLVAINADEATASDDDGNDTVTLKGLYSTSLVNLGGGNDIFRGGNGNDIVLGGLGNDDIKGGKGDDFLFGEGGNDRLRGQGGNDYLSGGEGVDRLQGGGGNDILIGGEGADRLEGGKGDDILFFDPGAELVTDFGTFLELEDSRVTGGQGIDTLEGSAGDDLIDFNDSALFTDIEIVKGGAGDDLIIGELGSTLNDQFLVYGGEGDDRISFFDVTTTNFNLSQVDFAFSTSNQTWTGTYAGAGGTVTITEAEIVAFDPSTKAITNLFTGSPNFQSGNIIDGGAGKNTLYGSEGTDIIFGGINTSDPAPNVDFDDFIYANGGNDLLIGGGGYDTYYIARDGGDNFIFDGSTAVGGFSNGLVFFEGFETAGDNNTIDYEDDQGNDNGVGAADVQFTNNQDGTWTIAFTTSEGSVTFAGHEISEIELQDNVDGGSATRVKYKFNDQGTPDDFSDDTYDLNP